MKTRVIRNEYIYSIITKIVIVAFGLLYQAILARYLGAELKGNVAYISSITAVASIISTLGLNQLYPSYRKSSKDPTNAKNQFMSIVIFLFGICVCIAVFFFVIMNERNRDLAVAILITPIFGYSSISGMVCLVENPNKRNGMLSIISIIEVIYVMILFLFTKRNYYWAVTAIVFSEIIKSFYFTYAQKITASKKYLNMKLIRKLFRQGIWLMIALLINNLNYKIDVLMLKGYQSVTLADIGVYSIGISIAEKAMLIPDAVKEILLSRLSKGADENEVCRTMRLCFPISVLTGFLLSLIAIPGTAFLFGKEYAGAVNITIISVTGVSFMVFMKMVDMYNTARLKQKITVILLSISVIVNIVCNMIFIPAFGITGAAIATSLGHLICSICFLIYFVRQTGISARKAVLIQKEDYRMLINLIKKFKRDKNKI